MNTIIYVAISSFFQRIVIFKELQNIAFFQIIAKFAVLNPECYFEVKIDNKSFWMLYKMNLCLVEIIALENVF